MMLAHRLYRDEIEIRDGLKNIRRRAIATLPASKRKGLAISFSLHGLKQRRDNAVALIRSSRASSASFEEGMHLDANSLNGTRRSAACPYEQFRARLWALNEIPRLFAGEEPMHWVTITHPIHRVSGPAFAQFHPEKVRRVVRDLRSRLAGLGIPSTVFGMVEVSVSLETGRPIFEPHAHFIIAGPTRNQLRAARRVLPKRSTRVQVVTSVQGLCLYASKFAAEERSAYTDDDGKRRRRRNGMKPAEKTAWLSWLARYGVEDLIIEGGFQPNLKTMFRNAEMGELLDRLVGRVSPNGPKMLSTRR